MTVIPASGALIDENDSAIKLAKYAQLAAIPECFLLGVADPNVAADECNPIWSYSQRAMIAKYLREAQDEIEQVTHYPLAPRWFTDESHPYRVPLHLDWHKVIETGVKAVANIGLAQAVDHTADPAVVGPIATTVTDPDEIIVYHPGTDIEIVPSSIVIAGGNVTINIPRCRLVTQAAQDNDENGIDYTDTGCSSFGPTGSFECFVDVKRVYNDASTQGTLVWPHQSSDCAYCGCPSCGEYTHDACVYIKNAESGAVDLLKAAYADGAWTADSCTCHCSLPSYARVNYRAGMTPLSKQAEDAIIRLAHAKMPSEPCGCGTVQSMWKRDRNVPEVLTRERLNCPFGLSDGAWVAWRFANALASRRLMVM